MRRSGQTWIVDSQIATMGFDFVFPDASIGWLEHGMRFMDYHRTMARVRSTAMLGKAWSKTAEDLMGKAREAEGRGHTETALEFYHRAANAYCKAFWGNRTRAAHDQLKTTYAKVIEHADYEIRRVEIPFEDNVLHGLLHLPPSADATAQTVIFVPGMDMVKEDYPNVQSNRFIKRGMACLAIDGPGQGETWLDGLVVTPDNYAAAGSAAIDFIEQQPELDGERVGVFGQSMGSYWAPTIAARDHRVKAVAGAMGCFLDKRVIFNVAPPSFRQNFMVMAGIDDDDEFDRMAEQMTLERFAGDIRCPTLLAHGEFDQLCSLQDARDLMGMLNCPRELWIFENEFHALGRTRGDMFAWVADWMRDKIDGRFEPDLNREVWIPEQE